MTETITPTSPLELIALLGSHMGTRAWYAEQEREMANLRKVYALCRANDPRWTDFLKLWASEAVSPAAKRSVLIILEQADALAYWQKMDRDEVSEVMSPSELRRAEAPRRSTGSTRVTEDGMYRNPATGEIFKVQFNRAKGDGRRLYAKRMVAWDAEGNKITRFSDQEADGVQLGRVVFEFLQGGMLKVKPEMKMSLEQAKRFGALYGTCCECGRTLTNEESIAAGIGPICAGKF